MLLVRSFEFSVETDVTGQLVDHVLSTVDAVVPVWAYLEDAAGAKVSAVARALKKHPSLARLGPPQQGTLRHVLASLPARADDPEPFAVEIERDLAIAVANGVPKSLPFQYSNFVLGPVPELWLAPGEPRALAQIGSRLGEECLASVVVSSSWSSPRRRLQLAAHLCTSPPEREARKLPALPPETRRLLDDLGRIHREQQHLIADEHEATARQSAEPAAQALVAATTWSDVPLPFPDLANDAWHADGEAFGSFKDELRGVFAGYRYQSALCRRGFWVLSKRTAAHNELMLKVDRGPIGGNAQADLTVRGPLWSHSFRLPVSRTATSLCVWNPATLAAVCRNWGAAVTLLERDVVPELERLYWPGFAWYSAGSAW